ncbi:MAG: efflux RND transporter periplasmic adaptor subunit, partial [Syntrophomonadaceae bacterium]|nr:efflux RND transporter periplasmic adaptor subunit [Syntrophomonadaceae bacterium]
ASVDVNLKSKKLQQSNLNLEAARADVENLNIRAPFDGILVKLGKSLGGSSDSSNNSSSSALTTQGLRVGDEVKAGSVVARLVNYQQMLVTIMVDEIDIPKVAVGQKAQITADALPGRQFSGEVVFVSSEGESENGVASFKVTIRIDQPEGLMAGMTVNADILVAEKTNVLLLPIEALQERAGRKYVTMAGSGDQKTAATSGGRQKEIKVGLSNETYVEVASGLEEGDQVLLPSAANSGSSQNQRVMVPGVGGPPPSGVRFRNSR